MTIDEAVKQRIDELCAERQITINKLSTICGMAQSTFRNITSGRNGATISTIKKICDGLEIPVKAFFDSPLFDDLEQEIK